MPRLTFDISEETHQTLCQIPHGLRKYAYRAVMESLAEYLEADSDSAIQHLLAKRLHMKSLLGADNGSEN